MGDFSLFIKRFYRIGWSVERMQKAKMQILQKQKKGRIMRKSKYVLCDSKNSKFVKEQEASRLLSSLVIKIPLNEIS